MVEFKTKKLQRRKQKNVNSQGSNMYLSLKNVK